MRETFVNTLATTADLTFFQMSLVIAIPLKWEFQRISKDPSSYRKKGRGYGEAGIEHQMTSMKKNSNMSECNSTEPKDSWPHLKCVLFLKVVGSKGLGEENNSTYKIS